jgi:hypothetical protein
MTCEKLTSELPLYVYGELSGEQEEACEQHLAQCAACRQQVATLRLALMAVDDADAALPPGMLASCRRELLAATGQGKDAAAAGFTGRLWGWMNGLGSLKPAGVTALLAIGFAGGLAWQNRPVANPEQAPALRVRSVSRENGDRVRIVLDEIRQREVTGALHDHRVRDLLLTATQEPADAGLRVASVDLLRRESADGDVRRALLTALVGDPNPGVRLKALEALVPHTTEHEVRRTLGQVLLQDDNPGVRTRVIDLLADQKPNDMVDVLQRLMQQEQNDYIRSRTGRALQAMNASLETF